jgi:hypothetical protein
MLDSSVYRLVYHARRGAMFSSISSAAAERRGAGDGLSVKNEHARHKAGHARIDDSRGRDHLK